MWFINGSQRWQLVFVAGLQPTSAFRRREDGNEREAQVRSAKGTERPRIPNTAITGCGTVNRP